VWDVKEISTLTSTFGWSLHSTTMLSHLTILHVSIPMCLKCIKYFIFPRVTVCTSYISHAELHVSVKLAIFRFLSYRLCNTLRLCHTNMGVGQYYHKVKIITLLKFYTTWHILIIQCLVINILKTLLIRLLSQM
jgi:hypothetical protein